MKVDFYSFGADSGGQYVVSESAPIAEGVLETLLPVPVFRSDGEISMDEAANMAVSHHFDDGNFEVIEPPTSEIEIKIRGYIVTFTIEGGVLISIDQAHVDEQERIRLKGIALQQAVIEVVGHPCSIRIGLNKYLARIFSVGEYEFPTTVGVKTDGKISKIHNYEGKIFADYVYENFSFVIEYDHMGRIETVVIASAEECTIEEFKKVLRVSK